MLPIQRSNLYVAKLSHTVLLSPNPTCKNKKLVSTNKIFKNQFFFKLTHLLSSKTTVHVQIMRFFEITQAMLFTRPHIPLFMLAICLQRFQYFCYVNKIKDWTFLNYLIRMCLIFTLHTQYTNFSTTQIFFDITVIVFYVQNTFLLSDKKHLCVISISFKQYFGINTTFFGCMAVTETKTWTV